MAIFVSNIVIEQGFDFDTTFQLEDTATATLLDLSGYSVESQLRKTYTSSTAVSFASTITDATKGKVQISMASTITADLKPGRYVYDVKLTTSGGATSKPVEGAALVRAGVTR
jgi:hypothetical protein